MKIKANRTSSAPSDLGDQQVTPEVLHPLLIKKVTPEGVTSSDGQKDWNKDNCQKEEGFGFWPIKIFVSLSNLDNIFKFERLKYVTKWIWYKMRLVECACLWTVKYKS